MKKTLTFVLTLAMILAMFTGLTLTASAKIIDDVTPRNSASLVNALTSAVEGDTILLSAPNVYWLEYKSPIPAVNSGVTLIVEEGATLQLSGNLTKAELYVNYYGTLEINGTLLFTVASACIVNNPYGTVIFGDNSNIINNKTGIYKAIGGSTTSVPENFNWNGTTLYNQFYGPAVTPDELNGLDIRTPTIVDPTAPTGTDKVNGNTGIEITADPPTLIDPADPYVATIFDAGYIGGSDLWFGTHLASSEPQELPSIDNGEGKGSIISLVTYNQHKVNGIYGIKGQIGIFARNDEAKTPVIEDFSLSLEATTTKWCKDDDSTFVPKYTAHNITSGFAMGPNEDPLKLFDTDTVGYMLSDYKGVLTLPADAVLATGVATAVMTWTIEAEVI